jgi:hypothetical protein
MIVMVLKMWVKCTVFVGMAAALFTVSTVLTYRLKYG